MSPINLRFSFAAFSAFLLSIVTVITVTAVPFFVHYGEIRGLAETTESSEKKLPKSVRNLLEYSLQGSINSYAARLLIQNFHDDTFSGRTVSWNITYSAWSFLLGISFSKQEQLQIIAELAPTGNGKVGLVRSSREKFNLELSDLSQLQIAELVVLVRNPSAANRPEFLAKESNQLLLRCRQRKD